MRNFLQLRSTTQTVLLITQDQLVRGDFTSGGKSLGLWRRARPMGEELPALVDIALKLAKRRPKRVLVLCSDVWMQMLTLQSSSTIGITDAELGRALTFEAESLSGLSALDSETGFVPLGSQGGQSHFWIVQLPRWQRDQIDEAIRQAGGIPAGVGHPAGVPTSLGDSGGPWRRVELWSNAVVAIEGDGDKVQRTNVINANPRGKTWFDELAAWRAAGNGAAREEWLTEDLSLATLADDANSVAGLETDEPLTRYLSGWSRTVGRKAAVPLIVPEARPLSKQQRSTIAAGLALVVGAVAFADYTIVQRKIQAASETTKGIKAKAAQLASFNKQITDTDKQREKEAKDRDAVQADVQSTQTALASHRYRWSKLLDLLAERCPNHLMVDRISSGNGKLILSGLSLGPDAANRLATVLGGELRELGWQVQPARKEASKSLLSGEPWKFQVELTDVPATAVIVATAPRPKPQTPHRRQPTPEPVDRVVSTRNAAEDK